MGPPPGQRSRAVRGVRILNSVNADLLLRLVHDDDLPVLFVQQLDPEGNRMAAFTAADPTDRGAFDAHWTRIRTDPAIIARTVTFDGEIVGHVLAFPVGAQIEVSYWIDRRYRGRGYATRALAELLRQLPQRPLRARAAKDNFGSLAVLRKCGFIICGEDRGYAAGRGEEVEEFLLELTAK